MSYFLNESDARKLPEALHGAILALSQGRKAEGLAGDIDRNMRRSLDASFKIGAQSSLVLPLEAILRTLAAGGALVQGDKITVESSLRPASVCLRAGARMETGLEGDWVIARETAASIEWLHEFQTATAADPSFGAITLVPHRASGATSISNQLDMQTGGMAARQVLESLAIGCGNALDKAALQGTGSLGMPLGILYEAGVSTLTFGGAASLAKAVNFESQIVQANGEDTTISFVAAPQVREKWKTIQRWTGASVALWTDEETVCGKPAYVTSNMPSTAIVAGDFTKLIFGLWGENAPVELVVNPYTQCLAGRVEFTATLHADCGLLRPNCFVRPTDSATQ